MLYVTLVDGVSLLSANWDELPAKVYFDKEESDILCTRTEHSVKAFIEQRRCPVQLEDAEAVVVQICSLSTDLLKKYVDTGKRVFMCGCAASLPQLVLPPTVVRLLEELPTED